MPGYGEYKKEDSQDGKWSCYYGDSNRL